MSIQEKYKKVILKKYPEYSDKNAGLLVDFLYKPIFIVITDSYQKGGKK